ncbi:MAG: hypothetical protein WBI04_06915 [Trichlorobacter sp.]
MQITSHQRAAAQSPTVRQSLLKAGVSFDSLEALAASLPFAAGDVTAGSESELQAVVIGSREQVDLPQIIEQSNYFANILKRTAAGETPQKVAADLERFLADNTSDVWENSWVRFARRRLSDYANQVLEADLLADKQQPGGGQRQDCGRFIYHDDHGEEMLRLPISYLIKLALADLIGSQDLLPQPIRETGVRLLGHYLNDNTSPETFSFNVVSLNPERGMGQAIAHETALRYLMTQVLVMYANLAFGLLERGQQAMVYFAPHPPVRQKELNDHVSDSFYRELFMSPCLSGWDKGEDKYRYMQLCHQVLSRSQLNAVAKLREAGVILNNLVVLPTVSNVSLANNGTHISIGSRRLSRVLADSESGFTAADEKRLGDLAIKVSEHFLPLFVGSYTAAPYRLGYTDFHPEKALGFLAHELDYTHLRMFWRRWQKKAKLSIAGQPLTPFGPEPIDRLISSLFGLKGDFVPDYRLIDYLVCLLSTERSPALNGLLGNTDQLRKDLAQMGVFDEQMSVYLLYKQREFSKMGFSGFEGRHYSMFERFGEDMGRAADLQTLITALAYKYMAYGTITGASIPDTPQAESERRQIFFGTAVGIPTFFVQKGTHNHLMARILGKTAGVRPSHRYPGYLRVQNHEYRKALLKLLREDAADLIEQMGMQGTIDDLQRRLDDFEHHSVAGRLTRGVMAGTKTKTPLKMPARDFNLLAEQYYRETLRRQQMEEAVGLLAETAGQLDREQAELDDETRRAFRSILQGQSAAELLERVKTDLLADRADLSTLRRLANLILVTVHAEQREISRQATSGRSECNAAAPVYRAG